MRECWVNVYEWLDGWQGCGDINHRSREDASLAGAANLGLRCIGRWRITLKEAPRDAR